MPGKNGLELLTELRAQNEAVDVIVISAASELDVIKKTLRYGAVDYLIKPFEFERFQTALSDYRRKQKVYSTHRNMSQKELDAELFQKKEATEKCSFLKAWQKARWSWSGPVSSHLKMNLYDRRLGKAHRNLSSIHTKILKVSWRYTGSECRNGVRNDRKTCVSVQRQQQ